MSGKEQTDNRRALAALGVKYSDVIRPCDTKTGRAVDVQFNSATGKMELIYADATQKS